MILIVEPDRKLARVIQKSLKNSELDSIIAHTSQSAIELAERPDLKAVIIELLIPRHNGLEFIYEFRSHSDWLNVPIIIYSQLSHDELKLTDSLKKDLGVMAHLYKPTTSLSELTRQLERVI